jgi:hypothetical protein
MVTRNTLTTFGLRNCYEKKEILFTLKPSIMRQIYALLLLACGSAWAQVPNSDFEAGTGYGLENVTAWGKFFIYTVTIDMETGENIQDEITFGDNMIGSFCTSTTDSHTGERAMLVRNAFNVTRNEVIPGEANLFNTEIADTPTGWNFGVPVQADADIELLSFWYKFAPLGNDIAEAKLTLFADGVGEVGSAKIQISEAANAYTYATVPITFTSIETPTFMTISFTMQAEGSTPVFGSYLTIDDLAVNSNALQTQTFEKDSFVLFPTVAQNTIQIQSGMNGPMTFEIIDTQGKTVLQNHASLQPGVATSIDVSRLSSGVYVFRTQNGQAIKKFIKK